MGCRSGQRAAHTNGIGVGVWEVVGLLASQGMGESGVAAEGDRARPFRSCRPLTFYFILLVFSFFGWLVPSLIF